MTDNIPLSHVPPAIIERDGSLYVLITHPFMVAAPIGDGRQFAARVLDMIVLPAIAPRVGDPEVKWPPPYSSPND